MWIKVCANTNLEDARLAANSGADAVGFVFAPSARRVTYAQAEAIARHLPAQVERIGVFESQDHLEILRGIEQAALTGAQLHRQFDPDLVRSLHGMLPRFTLTQTIHWDRSPGATSPADSLRSQLRQIQTEPAIERVLIDSRVGALTGGTGITFDWVAAAEVLRAELGDLKLIVAGGLHSSNVAEAIQQLAPWGVDVATGVESVPGKKDPEKLKAFIEKAST